MRRIRDLVLFAVVVSLGGLFLVSCGTSGGGGTSYSVLGEIDYMRMIAIYKNGSIDLSNFQMPITGEVVSTATVTLTNETTGSSVVLSFFPAYNWYGVPTTFVMNSGDQISVKIEIDGATISGDPTTVPNPVYSNLGPESATLPFTASWEVSYPMIPTYEASHTWFMIANEPMTIGRMAVIPISETSIQITSAEVSTGLYAMQVRGGNPMNLSGAASGSIVYITGGGWDETIINILP